MRQSHELWDDEPASCELINVTFKAAGILFLSQPACTFRERLKVQKPFKVLEAPVKKWPNKMVYGDPAGIGFPLDCQNPDRTTKYVPIRASTNKSQLGIAQAVSCPQLRCHHVLQIDVLFHYGYYWSGAEVHHRHTLLQKNHSSRNRIERLDYPPTASDHVGTNSKSQNISRVSGLRNPSRRICVLPRIW